MTMNSIGDLALSFQLRRQNAVLKADLNRFSQELSSGTVQDVGAKLRGNFSVLAGLERGISIADSYLVGVSEQRLVNSSTQSALEKLRSLGQISGSFLTVQETGDTTLVRNAGQDALERLDAAVQTLNTQVGGRTIFAGDATDQPAVADADIILTALEAEISSATAITSDDIAGVVDAWFDTGGGYDIFGYVGGERGSVGVKLSDNETAGPSNTAQDDSIRSFLAALAKGALIGRGILSNDPIEQGKLARLTGENLISANDQIIDLKARVGMTEAQIERAGVEVRSEKQALELAKSELVSIEPFETAVRFENAETQLKTLYSVTSRLSGLSLANYL